MIKRAIVTGATGFIGSNICKTLLERGVEVYGVGRNKTKFSKLNTYDNFTPIALDFVQYSSLPELIDNKEFEYFIHAALYGVNGSDKKDYKIQLKNTEVACNAVKIAKELHCKRFVMIGSVDEFESCFYPDSNFVVPNHARIYGLAKFAAEGIGKAVALDAGIDYVSAILCLTYGEGNKTNILPNMIIRNAARGLPMNLITGDNYFDMIYIKDAVEGILAVAEHGKSFESYFIGHHELRTFRQCVEEMCAALGTDIGLNFGSYADSKSVVKYDDIRRDKLYNDSGFYCKTSTKDAIQATREWLLNEEKN